MSAISVNPFDIVIASLNVIPSLNEIIWGLLTSPCTSINFSETRSLLEIMTSYPDQKFSYPNQIGYLG